MQTLQKLSPSDKEEFYNSLSDIHDKLDILVDRFYFYFLQTEARVLFVKTDMEKQHKMFHVTLAFLIAHIDNPVLLNKHLGLVITRHRDYGVTKKHIPFFIDSFMSALKELLDGSDDRVTAIWNSVIYEIMSVFNEQLSL